MIDHSMIGKKVKLKVKSNRIPNSEKFRNPYDDHEGFYYFIGIPTNAGWNEFLECYFLTFKRTIFYPIEEADLELIN